MTVGGYVLTLAAAFIAWYWMIKTAMGIWKYCYCGVGL
jgi:hypothetical protein